MVKPHNHNEFNKRGAPAPEPSATTGGAITPPHGHMKEHKQR